MRLSQYLDDHKISDAAFARTVGVAHSLVHYWRNGKKKPSLETVRRIRIATGGLVQEPDWHDDDPGAAKPDEAKSNAEADA
jgi:transcriptional regulator with XRE-family HTH domain